MATQVYNKKHMCESLKTCFAEGMDAHGTRHIQRDSSENQCHGRKQDPVLLSLSSQFAHIWLTFRMVSKKTLGILVCTYSLALGQGFDHSFLFPETPSGSQLLTLQLKLATHA